MCNFQLPTLKPPSVSIGIPRVPGIPSLAIEIPGLSVSLPIPNIGARVPSLGIGLPRPPQIPDLSISVPGLALNITLPSVGVAFSPLPSLPRPPALPDFRVTCPLDP